MRAHGKKVKLVRGVDGQIKPDQYDYVDDQLGGLFMVARNAIQERYASWAFDNREELVKQFARRFKEPA